MRTLIQNMQFRAYKSKYLWWLFNCKPVLKVCLSPTLWALWEFWAYPGPARLPPGSIIRSIMRILSLPRPTQASARLYYYEHYENFEPTQAHPGSRQALLLWALWEFWAYPGPARLLHLLRAYCSHIYTVPCRSLHFLAAPCSSLQLPAVPCSSWQFLAVHIILHL